MAYLLTLGSVLLVLASMPLSLMFVVKVVQVRLNTCTLLSFLRDNTDEDMYLTINTRNISQ